MLEKLKIIVLQEDNIIDGLIIPKGSILIVDYYENKIIAVINEIKALKLLLQSKD